MSKYHNSLKVVTAIISMNYLLIAQTDNNSSRKEEATCLCLSGCGPRPTCVQLLLWVVHLTAAAADGHCLCLAMLAVSTVQALDNMCTVM